MVFMKSLAAVPDFGSPGGFVERILEKDETDLKIIQTALKSGAAMHLDRPVIFDQHLEDVTQSSIFSNAKDETSQRQQSFSAQQASKEGAKPNGQRNSKNAANKKRHCANCGRKGHDEDYCRAPGGPKHDPAQWLAHATRAKLAAEGGGLAQKEKHANYSKQIKQMSML